MAAPLDQSPATAPIELAQAAPRTGAQPNATGDAAMVASLPADCERASLAVTVDQTIRYHLPEIPNVASFRKQIAGDAIVVTSQGHGLLVMDGFMRAAQSGHPPVIVLGDGTVLTAAQVLALPEQTLAPELCVPQQAQAPGAADDAGAAAAQQADQTPQALAQVAPAARTPEQLAQIAPAAGPGGAADGGETSGGHFNSTFAPTAFEGLNYGTVDPLAFSRTPPVLTPGTGTPEEAPLVNDSTLRLGDIAAKEDLGQAADQIASVPQPAAGPIPIAIGIASGDPNEAVTGITISGVPAGVTFNKGQAGPNGTWLLTEGDLSGLTLSGTPSDGDTDFTLTVTVDVSQNGTPLPPLTGTIDVVVDAVADLPTLTLNGTASGAEETAIALPDIAAGLQDLDGSESLTLTISGVPTGATLSAGTDNGDGSWTLTGLTQAQLDALTITPPADFSGSFDLTVTATATEAATTAGGGELQEADNV
ncbi:MAG: hypothetical protein JNL66_09485, partial [Alphaproteobacteria bacterium]|nr:hypothetical protein [Alphaproteobacteria bacterium]